MGSVDSRQVKLLCLDLVNEFNTGDRDGRMVEAFNPHHRCHSLFDSAMVPFDSLNANDKSVSAPLAGWEASHGGLDVTVGHHNAINQQLDQLPFVH